MSRIKSENINLGNSYVLNPEGKKVLNKEITDAHLIAETILQEAKKRAQEIVNQANQQSSAMIASATAEAQNSREQVTADARRQGYEEGYEEGRQKITQELQDIVENVNNFAKSEFEIKHRIVKSLHTDILDLVVNISEKICRNQLLYDKKTLQNVVENAILQLKEKENVTIIVNPQMAEKIYAISGDMKEKIHTLESIKIIEDNSISPDGTIVESVGSRIDARVSAQIEQISNKLFDELNSASERELAKEIDNIDKNVNDKPESI